MNYIYALKCPIAGVVRYIGKSVDPEARYKTHVYRAATDGSKIRTAVWIRELLSFGLKPELVILCSVQNGELWQDIEKKFIASAEANGWVLTNSTKGGQGLDFLDKTARDIWRTKLRTAMKAFYASPEAKLMAKERADKFWADPVISQKLRANSSATTKSDAHRIKMKAITKIRLSDPVELEKLRSAARDPERRAKLSAAGKRVWSDPNYVEKRRLVKEARKKLQ